MEIDVIMNRRIYTKKFWIQYISLIETWVQYKLLFNDSTNCCLMKEKNACIEPNRILVNDMAYLIRFL